MGRKTYFSKKTYALLKMPIKQLKKLVVILLEHFINLMPDPDQKGINLAFSLT